MKLSNKRWEEMKANQKKAEKMIDKFIAALKNLDCKDGWDEMLLTAILLDKDVEKEEIIDTLEMSFNMRVFSIENLAQELRFDAFLSELQSNPCQLQLIA